MMTSAFAQMFNDENSKGESWLRNAVDTLTTYGQNSLSEIQANMSMDGVTDNIAVGLMALPGGRAAEEVVEGIIAAGDILDYSIAPKIAGQMEERGWSISDLEDTLNTPSQTASTVDRRFNPDTGTRNNDPATAYFRSDGHYVVRNDNTGDIVQVSDRNKADWVRKLY